MKLANITSGLSQANSKPHCISIEIAEAQCFRFAYILQLSDACVTLSYHHTRHTIPEHMYETWIKTVFAIKCALWTNLLSRNALPFLWVCSICTYHFSHIGLKNIQNRMRQLQRMKKKKKEDETSSALPIWHIEKGSVCSIKYIEFQLDRLPAAFHFIVPSIWCVILSKAVSFFDICMKLLFFMFFFSF